MSTTDSSVTTSRPDAVGAPQDWSVPTWDRSASARRSRRSVIVVLLVIAALFAGGYAGLKHLTRTGTIEDIQSHRVSRRSFPVILEEKGELQASQSIDIRSEIEGRATIIHLIEEGRHVEEGDLLVELASDEIDEKIRDAEIKVASATATFEASEKDLEILQDQNASDIRKAELGVDTARLALQKFEEGEKVELIQDAELALEKSQSVLERATQDYEDSKELYEQDFVTRIELENDRFRKYEAEIELKKAKLALEVLKKYTIPMELRQKQSDLDEAIKDFERTKKSAAAAEATAEADVAAKRAELALVRDKHQKLLDQKTKSRITAPSAGLVVYAKEGRWYRSESGIEKGAQVHEQQSLIQLPDTSSMKVVIKVHEAKMELLELGLPAKVTVEGVTGKVYEGTISKIATLADSSNRWLNPNLKQYETEIQIKNSDVRGLKPGTTARAAITVAELNDVVAVPVQSVFAKGSRFYVFVENGNEIVPREVKVGLASAEFVEIREGLDEGERVRLSVTEEDRHLLPDDRRRSRDEIEASALSEGS